MLKNRQKRLDILVRPIDQMQPPNGLHHDEFLSKEV
jgi:hypothetical protein